MITLICQFDISFSGKWWSICAMVSFSAIKWSYMLRRIPIRTTFWLKAYWTTTCIFDLKLMTHLATVINISLEEKVAYLCYTIIFSQSRNRIWSNTIHDWLTGYYSTHRPVFLCRYYTWQILCNPVPNNTSKFVWICYSVFNMTGSLCEM